MRVGSTLYPARVDLGQLFPGEHKPIPLTHILQPATCTLYERSGDVERCCEAVTLECRKSSCIKISVAIVESQNHRSLGKSAPTGSHCLYKLCNGHSGIVTLL